MGSDKNRIIYRQNSKNLEENDELIQKCFEISSDVELKEIPNNGEEYILKVITERANVAAVTVCDKDVAQFAKYQSRFYKDPPKTKPAPNKLKPTIEWQTIQVSDFSDVRKYITDIKSGLKNKGSWGLKVNNIDIPDQSLIGWKVHFEDNDSTVSHMLGFSPKLLDMGLEMLTDIIREVPHGCTIDHKTGRWIYAFLACLQHPALSETICILRDLARACAEIRSHITEDEDDASVKVTPLNLFICIVARYFEQLDLAD